MIANLQTESSQTANPIVNPIIEINYFIPDVLEPQATLVYEIALDNIEIAESYSAPIIIDSFNDSFVKQSIDFFKINNTLKLKYTIENQGINTHQPMNTTFNFKKII